MSSRELRISSEALAAEVAWLSKMPTSGPETAVIQVTALLGAVMLRRTCYDQWQETVLPAVGVAQADILVDAGKLAAGLKSVEGSIIVTIGDGELVFKPVDRDLKVRIKAAELDYPRWPRFEPVTERATLGSTQLARVLTSVGTDEALPVLMMVAFDDGAMVATDRYRLTRIAYDTSGFTARASSQVLRTFAKSNGVVHVITGKCVGETADWIELSSGGRTVTAPMPDGKLPQWKKLIPDSPPIRVAVRRDDLLKAAGGDEVTITISSDTMTVISRGAGVEIEQDVALLQAIRHDMEGPLTVTLRSKYLNDCLRSIGSGLVLIDAGTEGPVVFQDVTENDLHLIMRVKTA